MASVSRTLTETAREERLGLSQMTLSKESHTTHQEIRELREIICKGHVCGITVHGTLTLEALCSLSLTPGLGASQKSTQTLQSTGELIFTLGERDAKAYVMLLAKIITEHALYTRNIKYCTKVK